MKFRKQKMIEAIFKAHEVNQEIIKFIDTIVAECGKAKACLRQAVQFRKSCLQRSRRSFLRKRWKKLYLQMRSRLVRRISVQITEKLEEAFAENEEWLAVIR